MLPGADADGYNRGRLVVDKAQFERAVHACRSVLKGVYSDMCRCAVLCCAAPAQSFSSQSINHTLVASFQENELLEMVSHDSNPSGTAISRDRHNSACQSGPCVQLTTMALAANLGCVYHS